MRNVQRIIDTRGGLEALKRKYIRLEVPGFMRPVIEHIGTGPRGGELVSVAHYGEQNGDLMRDPEIVFEIVAGRWKVALWNWSVKKSPAGIPSASPSHRRNSRRDNHLYTS